MCGKKTLAMLLAVITALSLTVIPVLADDGTGEELKAVILAVKSKIDIPDTYTEFVYSVNSDELGGRSWRLRWSQKDQPDRTISAVADEKGEITSYQKTSAGSAQLLPADFTREEAETLAAEFLYRANTTTRERFFSVSVLSQMDAFLVTFEEKVNEIPVKGSNATVIVNKSDRQISQMDVSRSYREDHFQSTENVISKEAAQEAYRKEIGFRLTYRTYVDYEKKTVKGYPVYTAPKQSAYALNAVTGKVIDITSENTHHSMNDAIKGDGSSQESASLSEAELAEIAKTQDLMTQQQAFNTVQQLFGKQFTLNSAHLNRSYLSETDYVWHLNLKDSENGYAYASIDAKNGLVSSFSNYNDTEKKNPSISMEQAQQKAAAIFQSNAGEISGQYQLNPERTRETENGYVILLNRYHDNIPVEDQSLSVTVGKDGKVESYHLVYYKDTKFTELFENTDAYGPIDANTAPVFDVFEKNAGFGVCYIPVTREGKTNIVLAYDFLANAMPVLDGKTLVPVDYRGEPIQQDSIPSYTDLEGHWVKDIVDTLAYNGIYMIKEDLFQPDEKVTESEFIDFLAGSTAGIPYPIRNLLENGKKEDILAGGNRDNPIDRQTAAKYIVKLLGYDELAAKPEAFQYLFTDQADEANKPYIMICYILDIMKGDASGSFNAEGQLTRAETAVILYNTLKNNKFRF